MLVEQHERRSFTSTNDNQVSEFRKFFLWEIWNLRSLAICLGIRRALLAFSYLPWVLEAMRCCSSVCMPTTTSCNANTLEWNYGLLLTSEGLSTRCCWRGIDMERKLPHVINEAWRKRAKNSIFKFLQLPHGTIRSLLYKLLRAPHYIHDFKWNVELFGWLTKKSHKTFLVPTLCNNVFMVDGNS